MMTSLKLNLGLALPAATLSFLLAGCGLAETAAVTATQAEAAATQAKQGKEMEEKVKRDIEAAQKAAADARQQVDEANQ